jgi:hypothetical protein
MLPMALPSVLSYRFLQASALWMCVFMCMMEPIAAPSTLPNQLRQAVSALTTNAASSARTARQQCDPKPTPLMHHCWVGIQTRIKFLQAINCNEALAMISSMPVCEYDALLGNGMIDIIYWTRCITSWSRVTNQNQCNTPDAWHHAICHTTLTLVPTIP